ncbi:hypothetical protein AVI51_05390 [Piscirickettsia salmonis]|uniref:Uncharacterized protein n=2 Tax=Piscirickettsia salmonis TaxID=1238 RepID=A0A9Q5YLH2_PISSA|nr:hypothetical protein [Piscirickettsia salmonis]RNC77736.1 hypothetical protein DA717_08565 [Piscirickettsiaceae bacterium NZ-RLO2]ALA25517.1 membrane protein [Piscirickettsia salmonis]APS43031.1 hypothetical protein AVI48_00610 [Piscirickettsia salmonis]APS46380.1 hypothetical protein AVI49_01205 [Piscirickettsia salmonis]APS50348.1 hypothetical protein AVI50_05455 [Piscirickettsia salmonis]
MQPFFMLMRREFWENRTAMLKAPLYTALIIGALVLLSTVLGIGRHSKFSFTVNNHNLQLQNASVEVMLYIVSLPLIILMIVNTLLYLLNTLFDDRQDRSILFWKSLPTTDSATVLSKLATAIILIPFWSFISIIVLQIISLIIGTIFTWHTQTISLTILWNPLHLIRVWAYLWLSFINQALWLLPIFSWCLLVSAYVKKNPLLYAILIPALLCLLERIILGSSLLYHIISARFTGLFKIWTTAEFHSYNLTFNTTTLQPTESYLSNNLNHLFFQLTHSTFWYGVIFTLICLIITVGLRKYRYEIYG